MAGVAASVLRGDRDYAIYDARPSAQRAIVDRRSGPFIRRKSDSVWNMQPFESAPLLGRPLVARREFARGHCVADRCAEPGDATGGHGRGRPDPYLFLGLHGRRSRVLALLREPEPV